MPDESFDSLIELLQAKDEFFSEISNKPAKKRKINDGSVKKISNNSKAVAILIDLLVSLLTKAPSILEN